MSEMYTTVGIPAEYVRGSDEPIYLDMPASYAEGLGQLLIEGVNDPKKELVANTLAAQCTKQELARLLADNLPNKIAETEDRPMYFDANPDRKDLRF